MMKITECANQGSLTRQHPEDVQMEEEELALVCKLEIQESRGCGSCLKAETWEEMTSQFKPTGRKD